jgi:hypothetical protein
VSQASTPVERQISSLGRYEGSGVRVAIVFLCIAPIVLVTLAVLNVRAASTHAKLADSSLTGVFTLWLSGPVPEATYSGHLVLALEHSGLSARRCPNCDHRSVRAAAET